MQFVHEAKGNLIVFRLIPVVVTIRLVMDAFKSINRKRARGTYVRALHRIECFDCVWSASSKILKFKDQ
jgi:hypothetical protein